MKTKLHTIKGASLECIEEYTQDLNGEVPDWVPYRVAIDGTETSALDAAMGGDTKHFSGVLRECGRSDFVSDGVNLTDEDGRLHDLGELLEEAAERLDQAHEEWAVCECLHRTRDHLLDRDQIALLSTILMTYAEDSDSSPESHKAVDALWNTLKEAKA